MRCEEVAMGSVRSRSKTTKALGRMSQRSFTDQELEVWPAEHNRGFRPLCCGRRDRIDGKGAHVKRPRAGQPAQQDAARRIAPKGPQFAAADERQASRRDVQNAVRIVSPVVSALQSDRARLLEGQTGAPAGGHRWCPLDAGIRLQELGKRSHALGAGCIEADEPPLHGDVRLRTRVRTAEAHEPARLDRYALKTLTLLPKCHRGLGPRGQPQRHDHAAAIPELGNPEWREVPNTDRGFDSIVRGVLRDAQPAIPTDRADGRIAGDIEVLPRLPDDRLIDIDRRHLTLGSGQDRKEGRVVASPRADLEYAVTRLDVELLKHQCHDAGHARGARRDTTGRAVRYDGLTPVDHVQRYAGEKQMSRDGAERRLNSA